MPSTIVPMGTYTVKKKRTAGATDEIVSPGAQTCVVVVLESPHGVAVAHIDAPVVAAQITSAMITELQTMGTGTITARLYGGDYGNPLNSSASISNPIYEELNRRQISCSHKDYHLRSGFVLATTTTLWAISSLGPESRLVALACIGLAYKATSILKAVTPENWQPRCLSNNIDVCVNIATGRVQLVKDNEGYSSVLLSEAKNRLIGGGQWSRITARTNLNPTDSKNEQGLAMIRV
ncbi:hypothetical protein [Legionella tunisiensis]|uniref:hypothetical protein n=1 Tax=Legionella tunisiensis TaxID=1034944 RepID=UPI00030081EA|nr:hypothetical protein [Legionella tunisiensis]